MVNWIVCNLGSRPIIFNSDEDFIAFCSSVVGRDDILNMINKLSNRGIAVEVFG